MFDGIDIPAVPLWSQLLPPDVCAAAPISPTEDAAHLESIRQQHLETMEQEVEMWETMEAQEFLEEHCVVSTHKTEGLPPTLQQYPDLLEHIKAILSTHGAAAAQGRRRDDKAYTIGPSTTRR